MAKKKFTEKQILEAAQVVVEGPSGSGKVTVVEYLKALLTELWQEEEGFSGKRPFGDSGWQFDVYKGFVAAKLIKGDIDTEGEEDWLNECDGEAGLALVLEVIKLLKV